MVIQAAVTKQLCSIPASALQVCFKDLEKCWKQCINAGGSYFKEDPWHQSVSKPHSFLHHQSWELSRHTFHTNTVLSTDINIHSNVAYINKPTIKYPRIKINNSKCKVSNI
jgi:hypothetical protein